MGKTLGDADDPLLVSVRSGSPFSMPGMMDTVLNLGLNDVSVQGLIAQTGNERFAWDSYRRFIQMFSQGRPRRGGRPVRERHHRDEAGPRRARSTPTSTAEDLRGARRRVQGHRRRARLAPTSSRARRRTARSPSRRTSRPQLDLAIEAVFRSWMNDRAVDYRKMEKIADDLGTAVNVQTMVFGNKGDTSATGVAFTRNPADGTKEYYGDFLDQRAGRGRRGRHPQHRAARRAQERAPRGGGASSGDVFEKLEAALPRHVRHRVHHRAGQAVDAADAHRQAHRPRGAQDRDRHGRRGHDRAARRPSCASTRRSSTSCSTRSSTVSATYDVLAKGLNASPGAAVGEVVFSLARRGGRQGGRAARSSSCAGRPTPTTCPAWSRPRASSRRTAARRRTRRSSRAAWASRASAASRRCTIDAERKVARVTGTDVVIHEGDIISIDGTTGIVVLGAVALVEPEVTGDFDTILAWADEFRTMGVRANADTPDDAALGRKFGAAGHRPVPHRAHVPRRPEGRSSRT